MADKYTKKVEAAPVDPEPSADAWKHVSVEKESTVKQKSVVTYSQLEQQKESQVAQKAACDTRIAEIEAQMSKVEDAAKAS